MKILIVFTTRDNYNPFVKELKDALERAGCEVTWSLEDFWDERGEYDIVHIQWPEYLFSGEWFLSDLERLRKVLRFWKERSSIILTRHNQDPHSSDGTGLSRKLYHLVYSYCDAIVHLGPYEIKGFISQYEKDIYGNVIKHTVIPHHIYINSYPNNISSTEARRLLGIKDGQIAVLIFGRIRHADERRFLKKFFAAERKEKMVFVAPSWLPFDKGNGLRSYLKKNYDRIRLWRINISGNIKVGDKFIADEDIQLYFNAADILLIPRLYGLNSGNVTLGYYFKKVIVGPRVGNIQFSLEESGNPVYEAGSIQSLKNAMKRAEKLVKESKGLDNYSYALAHYHPDIIGKRYIELYQKCVQCWDSAN